MPWHVLLPSRKSRRKSPTKPELDLLRLLRREAAMPIPVTLLGFVLGSVPKTASAIRRLQEPGDAIDGALTEIPISHEDYDYACRPRAESGLHVCPACHSKLVQPVRREQAAKRSFSHLWRRCPECRWTGDGVHGDREVDAFADVLQNGSIALALELRRMEIEGIGGIVDAFSTALDADLITADDFRPR
jgi:hypothetical protein